MLPATPKGDEIKLSRKFQTSASIDTESGVTDVLEGE
jgi:hypothetical protein